MAYSSLVISRTGLQGAREKLSTEFLPTMCLYAIVWPPIMALVFLRVPLRHQVGVGGVEGRGADVTPRRQVAG